MNDEVFTVDVGDGKLVMTVDHPEVEPLGTVALVPAFAVTRDGMFAAAYALSRNGFRVIRFDPRDHVGESSGEVIGFRLSRLAEDIDLVLSMPDVTALAAFSLGARPVLRSRVRPQAPRILVAPAVNVRHTTGAASGIDFFAEDYDPPEFVTVLGCEVAGPQWLSDCLTHRFVDATDAQSDARSGAGEVVLIAGRDDPWVHVAEVEAVAREAAAAGRGGRFSTVAASSHQLNRHPTVAMRFIEAMTRELLHACGYRESEVDVPSFSDVIAARSLAGLSARW